jgi:hypothetical protein
MKYIFFKYKLLKLICQVYSQAGEQFSNSLTFH